jgi:hypothetical protein
MTIPNTKVSFSYKNYFRPTPKNLQYFSEIIEGLCLTLATVSYVQNNPGAAIALGIIGYFSNKAVKFFGRVIEDSNNEQKPT